MRPNIELLRRTLDHIKANPQEWDQHVYREIKPDCGTAMCFAGWTAELAGGKWKDTDGYLSDILEAVPEDYVKDVHEGLVDAHARAQRLLGLTDEEAEDLFHPSNNLAYIEQAVNELCVKARRMELGLDEDHAAEDGDR